MSDSLRPHDRQQARPPCPSPSSRVHPNSCPLSRWCHPAISSSVVPFSSCPQSLPASESFPMSQLFAWGGQSIGVSALSSVLPKNTQDWSPLGWTGWISCITIMLFLQMRKLKHGHMTSKWGGQDVNSGRSHRQCCLPFVYSSHPEELETLTFHFWMLQWAQKDSHRNLQVEKMWHRKLKTNWRVHPSSQANNSTDASLLCLSTQKVHHSQGS